MESNFWAFNSLWDLYADSFLVRMVLYFLQMLGFRRHFLDLLSSCAGHFHIMCGGQPLSCGVKAEVLYCQSWHRSTFWGCTRTGASWN
jgi:hypothetical protein